MYTEVSLLDIIFRITIFGLFVYKFSQLIRNYFLPFLKDQITQEINQRTELIEKEKLLVSTRHRIENQIYKQKQTLTMLEKNVQIWHNKHVEQNLAQEKINRAIIHKIEEKRNVQRKNIILSNNINHTLPFAIQQAKIDLIAHYQQDAGTLFLKKILDKLQLKKEA